MILHIVSSDHPLRCTARELFREAKREDELGGRELTVCVTRSMAWRIHSQPGFGQINSRVSEIVRLDEEPGKEAGKYSRES